MKRLELTNKIFGNITVTGFSHMKNNSSYWYCSCKCGNVFSSRGDSVKRGDVSSCKQQSCHPKAKPPGTAAFNYVIARYKQQAKTRNLPFSLSNAEFKRLILSNCHYCRKKPQNKVDGKVHNYNGDLIYSGIDRKDNDKGYYVSNCVPSCKECNFLKKDVNYKNFLSLIKIIYNNLKGEIDAIIL